MIAPWTVLRAHRWPVTLLGFVALAGTGTWYGQVLVAVPFAEFPVPLSIVVMVFTAVVAPTPLYSSFPELEAALARERLLRAVRVGVVVAATTLSVAPAWTATPDPMDRHADLLLGLWMLTAAVVGTVALGELAWAPPLCIGAVAMVYGASQPTPLPGPVQALPVWPFVLLLGAACLVHVVHGPRRARW